MRKLLILVVLLLSASALAQNVGPDQRPHSAVFNSNKLRAPTLTCTLLGCTFTADLNIGNNSIIIHQAGGSFDFIESDTNFNYVIIDSSGQLWKFEAPTIYDNGVNLNFNQSNMDFGSDAAGIRVFNGTAPTMGACGTSPSVTGTNNNMLVTIGTGGAATSCAVNFNGTWTTAPVCEAQSNTDKVAYQMVTTTTTLTVSAAAAFTASGKLHIHCWGL